ncbi:glycoside hydrolase family protein [Shewanella algae]|uniref:glycoside hydrolase family protein n=1 Tax=Shewanella algae TaxID=38313 RepID=UPI002034FB7A|nr:glycoside hydrolase family protein [Shewanella algae]MCM2529712.1 glycoside hydrolase family protein [Shewanella algae]
MAANVITLLNLEEGRKLKPYYCKEGFPTIGIGFRIGPKGAPLEHYTFELNDRTCNAWLASLVDELTEKTYRHPLINAAMCNCNHARQAVLLSMAYQMGLTGLGQFKQMLTAIADNRWTDAGHAMLDSLWALQTPERAERHRQQMVSGQWLKEYGGDYVG